MASLLNKAFTYLFKAYIFITIVSLSGSLYGFTFYTPMCLLVLPFAIYSLFYNDRVTPKSLAITLLIPIITSLWVIIGLCNEFEFEGVKGHFAELILTFFTCWIIYIFTGNNRVQQTRFLRLVIISVVASSLFKMGIIVYAVTHNIPVVQMVLRLNNIFGGDIMTMDLGNLFGRIQFAADGIIPACIFIILRHREQLNIGSLQATMFIMLLLASVLFSFSRYYWACTVLALVIGLVLGKKDRFQALFATIAGISVLISLPSLYALYELRFSDVVAGGSDTERAAQVPALEQFFWESPAVGHGLGSYTTQLLRAQGAGRHNYEIQLLALLGQIGLVGVTVLLVLFLWYFDRLWRRNSIAMADRIGLVLLLLVWIAGGFSNPLLFNPVAGVVYAALKTLADLEAGSDSHLSKSLGLPKAVRTFDLAISHERA